MSVLNLRLETNDGGEPWIIEQKTFNLLNNYLQPYTTLSSTAVAKELDSLFPLNRAEPGEKEEPASFLCEMWGVVIKIAKQVPWKSPAQDKLAELLRVLRDLPSEMTVQIWGSDSKIWKDLPLLGPNLVEVWHGFDLEALPHADQVEERQCWQNLNAFEARLTRDGTCDCQLSAIWALREALEEEPDPRARAYQHQGPVLDCYVPVAAEWILLCGRILFGSKKNFEAVFKGGRLWKGTGGFSLERWHFWKERFGVISEHDQVSEQTKQAAREAKDMMIKIENESKE